MSDEFAKELAKLDGGGMEATGPIPSTSMNSVRRKRNLTNLPSAEDFAEETLKEGHIIATLESTYVLQGQYRVDAVSSQFDTARRTDGLVLRIEFERTDDDDIRGPRRIDMEAALQHLLYFARDPSLLNNMHVCFDMGSHQPWNFVVFPHYLITVPEFLHEADAQDKDRATLLKIATHAFVGLKNLHSLDIMHGSMRPENILIGMERDCRRILIGNFTCASSLLRDLPKPNDLIDMIYASRGRQRNFEPTRKDDLESWTYCIAEIFHRKLIPWHIDQRYNNTTNRDILNLKRAFCHGKLWSAQKKVMFEEFRLILSQLAKVRAHGDPPYHIIWNLLCTAAHHMELQVFGLASWCKTNRGAFVTPSTLQTKAQPLNFEDLP